jgi:hypothetical protein
MGTDTRETKTGLVDSGLRGIPVKHRRQLARDLLLAGSALPFGWLSAHEIEFLALRPDAVPGDAALAGGAELLRHLSDLCGRLVPELVDAHAVRHALDPEQRRHLHQNRSVLVRNVLLRDCSAWPGPDVAALDPALFAAVDAALTGERAQQRPAGPDQRLMLRTDGPPAGNLDAEERNHTWVTSDDDVLKRHLAQSREQSRRAWADTMRGLVNGAGAAAVFVAVFLLLRCSGLGLTFRQDLVAAAASTGASVVGLLRAFVPRDRLLPGRGPLAGRPRDAEPARPDLR